MDAKLRVRTHARSQCPAYEQRSILWQCVTGLKRLKQDTFSWPKSAEPQTTKLRLSPEALALLTDDVDLRGPKLRPWYERDGA